MATELIEVGSSGLETMFIDHEDEIEEKNIA